MRNVLALRSMILLSAAFVSADLIYGQDAAKQTGQSTSSANQQKAAAKPHKVWTDDDLGTIRSRGGITVAAAQNPTIPATADASPSPAAPAKTSGSTKPVGKAALSNPKTAEDAEGMIAWEQRDIDSQQEFVDRLQTELEQAPPDQREHLQKTLAEHRQSLADTRQEQQALIAQKKLLEKKPASETSAASSQSPQ